MDLHRLDLNLLKIFDSVYRLRNLTEVAHEVSLSQPAISHALGRLRTALDDRLFIRTATGLEPTARADSLAIPVRNALAMLEDSLLSSEEFKPEHCAREFRLLLSDVGNVLFIPPLLSHLHRHAPQVRLKIIQAPRSDYERLLRDREADIAIGHLNLSGQNIRKAPLFRDRCVILSRAASTGKSRRPMSREDFEQRPHVIVSPPEDPVEEMFSSLHIVRRISLHIPSYFALPGIVSTSELLATVPSRIAMNLSKNFSFDMHELPFASPVFDVKMHWHLRQDADVAQTWLRNIFHALFAERAAE
ncbi:MAG TPA: LysR family transcriptional regulator [Bordetella sp.]